ncbi:MAG: FAD-binding oxidoreductase [Methylobacteriaceae bacterium]|nr:FAD-binding oxidoreductase [Methylobacteriaceae bacterium]
MIEVDVIIIGAGASGAGLAFHLAARRRVLMLEAESAPGYHSTGRSAALYTPNIGPPPVRAINQAGSAFFASPPEGLAQAPLLTRRGGLTIARPGAEARLAATLALSSAAHPVRAIDAAAARALAPFVRPEQIGAAAYEPGVMDMDVAAIHQLYLRSAKRDGAALACSARATRIERRGGVWRIEAGGTIAQAPVVVNAAGAWGDAVATLAGVAPVGLVPKRRTAILVEAPGVGAQGPAPLVEVAGEAPYLKPESGRVMVSPADETPVAAHDVQPDDMDVALIVDWLTRLTTIEVKRAPRAWAGLRSFVADGLPVVGFDPDNAGFFWLVGQGGYGIMMSPTLGRLAAALIVEGAAPADLTAAGIDVAALAPRRAALCQRLSS